MGRRVGEEIREVTGLTSCSSALREIGTVEEVEHRNMTFSLIFFKLKKHNFIIFQH